MDFEEVKRFIGIYRVIKLFLKENMDYDEDLLANNSLVLTKRFCKGNPKVKSDDIDVIESYVWEEICKFHCETWMIFSD